MYSISNLILAGIVSLIVGLLVGVIVSRKLSPDNQKQRELERNVDKLLQQQKDYQHEVAEHFTDTAKLLNNLAESYRDVHNHLANGATTLIDDIGPPVLSRIPDTSLAEEQDSEEFLANVQQPLDYAPKSSPYETGMLNEEFGLDKVEAEEELEEPERV